MANNSPSTVQEWLQSLHLEQFLNDFLFSGYTDISKCSQITKEDLIRLGIKQVGYQKRILSRLPSEADAIVMEFSPTALPGGISNGAVPGQPIPSPRKPELPELDNANYIEVTPQRSMSCKPKVIERGKGAAMSVKPTVPPRRNQPPPLPERGIERGGSVRPVPQPRTHRPPPSAPSPLAPPPVPTPTPPLPSPSPSVRSTSPVKPIPTNPSEVMDPPNTRLGNMAESNFVAIEPVKQSPSNPFKCSDSPEPELPSPIITNPFNPFNPPVVEDLSSRPVPLPPPSNSEDAIDNTNSGDGSKASTAARIDLVSRPVPPPPVVEPAGHEDLMNRPVPLPPPSLGSSLMPAMEPESMLMDAPPPPLPKKKKSRSRSDPGKIEEILKNREPPPPLPTPIREENTPLVPLPAPTKKEDAPTDSVPTPSLEDDAPAIPALPPRPTPLPVPDIPARESLSTEIHVVNVPTPDSPPNSPPPNNPPPSIPPPPLPPLPSNPPISNAALLERVMEQNGNYESDDISLAFHTKPSINQEQNSNSLDSSRKSDHSCRSSQDDTLMVPSIHSESDHNMSTESDQIMNVIEGYSQSDIVAPGEEEYSTLNSSMIIQDRLEDPSNIATQPSNTNSIYGAIWEDDSTVPPIETVTQTTPFKKTPLTSEEDDYMPSWECETGQPRPISMLDSGMPQDAPPTVPQSFQSSIPQGLPPPLLVDIHVAPPLPQGISPALPQGIPPPLPLGHPPALPLDHPPALPDGHPPALPQGHPPSLPQGHPPALPQGHPPAIPQLPARVSSTPPPPENSHPQVEATSSGPPIPIRPAPPPPNRGVSLPTNDVQSFDPLESSEYEAILAFTTDDDSKQDPEDGYDVLNTTFPPALDRTSSSPSLHQDDVPEIPFQELSQNEDSDNDDDPSEDYQSDFDITSVDYTIDRNSQMYATIKSNKQPYKRHIPAETRRRLSMRLSNSSSARLPNKLEKSGYLWKCGAGKQGKGGFRKRWFVFNGKELRYYENEKTMQTCKGIIPVGTMLDVKHLYKSSNPNKTSSLQIGDKKSRIELQTNARTYYFATDSCDDGTIWANMLMQALIAFQPPPGGFPKGGEMSCPDKEGFLKMEGSTQKRYIAIKGEMLCYYSSDKDFEAAVPISDIEMKLANAKVHNIKPEKIVLSTPSTTYNLTAETVEEAQDWVKAMMEAVGEGLSDKLYLHKVWENEANKFCADCSMPEPDWCSLNFGIVVCKKCSGIHRQLGVHMSKVRSLKMDVKAFTDTALEVFSIVGNKVSNAFWEKMLEDDNGVKPMPDDGIEQRKLFIVQKYVDRQYCEQILWEKDELGRELLKAVQRGNVEDCLKLIFSGADVEAKNEENKKAEELAMGYEHAPVIKEILRQNKEYSSHQQELRHSSTNVPLPDIINPKIHGSPDASKRRNTAPGQDLKSNSPKPARVAPPPPTEQFQSSVTSKNEEIRKAGYLFKTGSNRKDFQRRYCILEHGTFKYFQDDKALLPKNTLEGTDIVYVAIFNQKHGSHEYCFEIGTTLGRLFLFAAEDDADRRNWMSALVKFHTPECMWNDCRDFEYAGFLRKKTGRSSTVWHRHWFLFKGKSLSFFSAEKDGMDVIDLRKAWDIKEVEEESSAEHIKDISIVVPGAVGSQKETIYLRADTQQISDTWMAALHKNSSQIGPELEDQLLNEDNIPYIVKECINFVYIHQGLEQEGIYRLSGTATKIQRLREMFKTNPKAVRIDRNVFEVNDVTGALKKYFRELPDPVLTKEWYSKWVEVTGYNDHDVKLQWYKHILDQLPRVHYYTLKTMIGHLRRVMEKERVNKMTDKNLASVFGPTLMALPDSSYGNAEKEISVIGDLMTYHEWLFEVSKKEWEEETKAIMKLIQIGSLINSVGQQPKSMDSFVVSFYIRDKTEGNAVTLPVSMNMTAKEVVDSVVDTHRLPMLDGKSWGLFEITDNGELERMLFDYEVVLTETVSAWPQSSAANNYLCIKLNSLMHGMEAFMKNLMPSATIKFAEGKQKFKDYYFEVSSNIMRYSKTGGKSTGAINQFDIIPLRIYVGVSSRHKKNAPTGWAITFLSPGEKEYKCLCFDTEGLRNMWLAALFRCKLSSAVAYASKLKLNEPGPRTALSTFESAAAERRERTGSGKGRFNLKSIRNRRATPSE